LFGAATAKFITNDLYELNEPLGRNGNTLALRNMDLYNNAIGRRIGLSVPKIWRDHYVWWFKVSTIRNFHAEFRAVERKCWDAVWSGRLRLR
jgi:hypothetical protein